MSDMGEIRTVYTPDKAGVTINVMLAYDADANPGEFDCYSDADKEAWRNDEWQYVGIIVAVELRGVTIGGNSLWGVEHGQLAEVRADAFEFTPAQYGTVVRDGVTIPSVTMGSPLFGVLVEALAEAESWLASIGAPTSVLDTAKRWADPNKKGDE